jgi:hypothetical protein
MNGRPAAAGGEGDFAPEGSAAAKWARTEHRAANLGIQDLRYLDFSTAEHLTLGGGDSKR